MPTGYTASIYEGKPISAREFFLLCARGMGAFIMQRDDPHDAPPDFSEEQPSSYSQERLAEEQAELARLQAMTVDEADAEAEAEYQQRLTRREEAILKDRALRIRYGEMLGAVEAWQPPTPDHLGFKQFMAEQLQQSIEFDCGSIPAEPQRVSGEQWLREQIASAERDIAYHTRQIEEERERVAARNAWKRALFEALPPEDAPVGAGGR